MSLRALEQLALPKMRKRDLYGTLGKSGAVGNVGET
jgi:hypothetical protein